MTDFDFDHIDNEQESHQDELEGFRAVEAIYKELLDHARQRIAELEAKPKDDPIHQQESQRYMVHLWNTSATGIECGVEAGTVVGKSRIAEVNCAECITSLNSQPEPHKFEYCEVAHCDCGLCAKCSQAIDDPIHQQESQQCGSCAGNLPNHEAGCFYKLAQESQPATYPAEGSRVDAQVDPKWKEKMLSLMYEDASVESAREGEKYAISIIKKGYNGDSRDAISTLRAVQIEMVNRAGAELAQAKQRIAELEKHAGGLINGGMASKEWSRAERQMRKLLEERRK